MRNFTPHTIHLLSSRGVRYDRKRKRFITKEPIILETIESSGILNVIAKDILIKKEGNVKFYAMHVVYQDPLPEGDDLLIVSAQYKICQNSERCITVFRPVYYKNEILGCLGFRKGKE